MLSFYSIYHTQCFNCIVVHLHLQYYMDNHAGGHAENKDGGLETRKFFVNCLCLLLGRLDSKRFESTVLEFGMNISRVLVPQVGTSTPSLDETYCKYIYKQRHCTTI